MGFANFFERRLVAWEKRRDLEVTVEVMNALRTGMGRVEGRLLPVYPLGFQADSSRIRGGSR